MLQSLEPTLSPSSEYSSASKYLLNTWEPKLDTVFQMWPHKCQVNEKSNFPSSAGSTLVNVVWCVVSLHYLKDAVLILVQFFHCDSQIPFCRAATSSVSPQAIPLHGIFFLSWVQDFVLSAPSPACSRSSALSSGTSDTFPVSHHACAEGEFQLIIQITKYVKQHKP